MDNVIAFLIAGLGVGAIYSLLGLGIMTLYRATGVLNFAFAGMGMLAVFCYWSLTHSGVPSGAAAAITVVSAAPGGALLEWLFMRRLRGEDQTTKAVATIALLVGLIGVVDLVWGTTTKAAPDFLPRWHATIGGVRLPSDRVTTFAFVAVVLALLSYLFARTRIGVAMRATANDRETAALIGIPVGRLTTIVWAGCGSLSALALLLVAPSRGLGSADLSILVIPGLAAAVIGDLRSAWGVTLGGLTLGVLEAEAGNGQWTSNHTAIIPFVVLLIILLWRQRKVTVPSAVAGGGRA